MRQPCLCGCVSCHLDGSRITTSRHAAPIMRPMKPLSLKRRPADDAEPLLSQCRQPALVMAGGRLAGSRCHTATAPPFCCPARSLGGCSRPRLQPLAAQSFQMSRNDSLAAFVRNLPALSFCTGRPALQLELE